MNASSAKERRALILRMLEQKEEVSVIEISQQTGISEVTIWKDLTMLQNRHLLLRTRGGAMRKPVENTNEDTAIERKRMFNVKEKSVSVRRLPSWSRMAIISCSIPVRRPWR